jgi:hypothetical protein
MIVHLVQLGGTDGFGGGLFLRCCFPQRLPLIAFLRPIAPVLSAQFHHTSTLFYFLLILIFLTRLFFFWPVLLVRGGGMIIRWRIGVSLGGGWISQPIDDIEVA